MSAKNIREQFFKELGLKTRVSPSHMRALKIYFNNRQHNHRAKRDKDLARLRQHFPLGLDIQSEADYYHLLAARCYIDPYPQKPACHVWRDTKFTRALGTKERRIMASFHSLYLVDFRDEQTDASARWEAFNRPGHESWFVVPVYEMRSQIGESFRFIIRPWQSGKDAITIV